MKPKYFFLLAMLVTLALGGLVHAQDANNPQAVPEDYKREKIQDLIVMRLNSELGLNPTQSAQLAQILRKYQQKRSDTRRQLRELTGQLRNVSGSGNDKEIQALLKQVTSLRSQLDQVDDQMFAEMKPMLTSRQQAQYLLVMDEIRQEIRAIRHPPAGQAPGPYPYPAPGPNPGPGTSGANQGAVHVGPPYY
ncbi:MAG: periplasmic heavy metal sensor [Deltaproteobacteria bacterium]|nr:periplasmic heavy metal sensor [Deltaproteobacteria bacterium]